jgi:aminoglycoside phosphotransferase (APT) family kinase protein
MSKDWQDRPAAVRPGEELDSEQLEAYLKANIPGLSGELVVEQFPRGFSNLTYLLRLGERELVLRRPPFGARIKSAHDMGREFAVLSGLVGVYPKVPRPLIHCADDSVIGAPFYVMTRLEGIVLRPQMPAGMIPPAPLMAAIAESFTHNLVALHAVDYAAAGLGDLGHPEGYVGRQIEGWSGRYLNARTDDVPEMERTAAWLADNMPPEYPLMDLGTSLGYWLEAGDPPEILALQFSPTSSPGNPTRAELVDMYARKSGRDVPNVVFYYVYGLFKLAVIVQQIYYRYKRGYTQDPRFAKLIQAVRACGRMAVQAIDDRKGIDRPL